MTEKSNLQNQSSGLEPERLRGYVVAIDAFDHDQGAQISYLYSMIKRRLIWLVAAVVTGFVAGYFVSKMVEEKFLATTVISYVGGEESALNVSSLARQFGGGLGSLSGLAGGDSAAAEESFALLSSNRFLGQFIQQRQLMPVMYADDWSAELNDWIPEVKDDPPSLWNAINKFRKDVLSISRDARTGLIELSIMWQDPSEAAEIANALVLSANQTIRDRALSEAESSIEFLRAELERSSIFDVRQGIFQLMQSHFNTIMVANVRQDFAFRIVDPAIEPDSDDQAFPNRALFALTGSGLCLMLVFALVAAIEIRNDRAID